MQELTKVFKDVTIPVEVIDEKNIYFNITGIAKKYGKNITDWKKSKRILELAKQLEKSNGSASIKTEKKKGSLEETKIHRSLLMNFARFISVEFEIEADKILYDILTGEKKLIESQKTELIEELEYKQKYFKNQLLAKDKEIEKAKRKAYAYERAGQFQCLTRIIKDSGADISISTLRKILIKEDMVFEKEVAVKVPVPNKKESIEEDGQILFHKDTVMKIMKEYEVEFKDDDQMLIEF
jgi:hypothetical protein